MLAALSVTSLLAHHAPSAIFDMTKKQSVQGTLTKVDWVNPHIVVFVERKAAEGTTDSWKYESNPPSWFRQVGMGRADFAKALGQTVTIEGVHAVDGTHYGYMQKITFEDGNSVELTNPAGAPEGKK